MTLHGALGDVLKTVVDLDRIVSHCIQIVAVAQPAAAIPGAAAMQAAARRIQLALDLQQNLEVVPSLRTVLAQCSCPLIRAFAAALDDARFGTLARRLRDILDPTQSHDKSALGARYHRVAAIRPGVSSVLDVARQTYCENVDDIRSLVEQLAEHHGLTLTPVFQHNAWWIQAAAAELPDPRPADFRTATQRGQKVTFTTADLRRMNARADESAASVYAAAAQARSQRPHPATASHPRWCWRAQVLESLLRDVRAEISAVHKLREAVSMMDVLWSFADSAVCNQGRYTMPVFGDALAIRKGQHPLLLHAAAGASRRPAPEGSATEENEAPENNIVPNDTFMTPSSATLHVITGRNMAGKSVYLRQLGLLQIMAQIGSFVPAAYACVRPAGQIFTHLCGDDTRIEDGISSFVEECTKARYILGSADATSLVLVDELGRGTSPQESVGLCWAICEGLLRTGAFTFFTTHLDGLTALEGYPAAQNFHISAEHVAVEGACAKARYGLEMSRASSMPSAIVDQAARIADAADAASSRPMPAMEVAAAHERLEAALATRLKMLRTSVRSGVLEMSAARGLLHDIRVQHLAAVARVGPP